MTAVPPSDAAGPSPDWATRQTNRTVALIDQVKRLTTDNVVLLVRALVIGLLFVGLASSLLVLVLVALLRLADAYLPLGGGVGDATWAAHLFVGALLTSLGAGLWMSRGSSSRPLTLALIADGLLIVAVVCVGIVRGLT